MCGRATKCIIDSLLLFLLSLQTLLLVTLVYQGYWEIPTWVGKFILDKRSPKTVSFDLGSIRYYPKKGIEVKDISMRSSECFCPLLTIDKILLIPANSGVANLESVEGMVQNAVFYFPDPYLPETENLKLIDGVSIRFLASRKSITLESFKARISELSIASLNPLKIDSSLLMSLRSKEPKEMDQEKILNKLREIRFLHDYFRNAEEALLTFTFHQESETRYSGDINLFAASSRMMDNVTSQGVYLVGKLVWDGDLFVDGMVNGELRSLRFADKLKLEDVAFEFLYERDDSYSLIPNRIRAHSAKLSILDHPFDYLTATAFPKDLSSGHLETAFGFGRQYLATVSDYQLDAKTAVMKVRGDLNPMELARQWIGDHKDLEIVKFDAIPHVSASFRIVNWNDLEDIKFKVISENPTVSDVSFAFARAWGSWDRKSRILVLDHFIGCQPTYTIKGRLLRDFTKKDYRYVIWGEGLPPDLNPMFQSWWSELWESFDFRDHPVRFDIDIWGNRLDSNQRFVYGGLAFEDIVYKGLSIDYGELKINTIAKYIDLFDLSIQNSEGVASGRIQNVIESDGERQISRHIDLFTDIPIHRIAMVVGEELDPIVNNTSEDVTADIWLNGTLIKEDFPEFRYLDDLFITVHIPEPAEIFGVTVESADAKVRKRQDEIRIEPVSFEFAKGKGEGTFVIDGPDSSKNLEFSVKLDDFDFREAIDKISAFSKDSSEAEVSTVDEPADDQVGMVARESKTATTSNPENGGFKLKRPEDQSFMDFTLVGSCPIGDKNGLQAIGSFQLDDPLIHRVHMFGGFSKLMDNAEMNLGSFSLKKATSPLRIDGSMLYFDDLELTGPSSRVKSKGSVNLSNGELDFRLKAYPLDEVKFPVVAGLALVLRPFVGLFEVQLDGTLEDPEWKVVIDPSGL